ncbi:ABC transporter permease [Lutispora thermophila]|uniref:NitT/TauT family transport system permease protein n=1 Tax=Lutispora thermophila DSM 19022 TaxID=1122184 RepID=A0A1M6I8E5_9FIRM|nr:ABC transporter permease [Lutispora thermophila]SHJ30712.1 NitT/TauT family transport system permease protein [Lutispora thermophila DSM 19022]
MKLLDKMLKNKTLHGIIIVIIIWYLLHISVESNVIPSPYNTFKRFFHLFPKVLSIHLLASLVRIMTAVGISIIIGVPFGLWIGMSKKADSIISPVVYILYPLPKIAFLPIFMILLGIGNTAKITLIVTIIIFQILIGVRDGIKEIPKELYYSVISMGVSKAGMYRHLIMPAILPRLFSALRLSLGISISTLFFAENFATTYGIGYYIMNAWVMVDYLDMFSGILALSLLGLLLLRLMDLLEKKFCPWVFLK